MKLNNLKIRNFKGIKSFDVELQDEMTISGANGTGKTTIFDAFLWLLFGKDSTGRTAFRIRPLDSNNVALKGLVVSVEAEIEDDTGTVYVLRKEHHERVVKKQLKGYETVCSIDEVPKSVTEFKSFVGEIIEEDKFKVLANRRHFSEVIDWNDRRKILLEIAGEISKPEGFDEILEAAGNREIKDYETVLKTQKKKFTQEQSEINPRIDEIQHNQDMYAANNFSPDANNAVKRTEVESKIKAIDADREKFQLEENDRQLAIANLNQLRTKKSNIEIALAKDTSGTQHLLDKKNEITTKLDKHRQAAVEIQSGIDAKQLAMTRIEQAITHLKQDLKPIQKRYAKTKDNADETKCVVCGQTLPDGLMANVQEKKQAVLKELTEQGEDIMEQLNASKAMIGIAEKDLKELADNLRNTNIIIKDGEKYRNEQFVLIDDKLAAHTTKPPEEDEAWIKITQEIEKAEAAIGEPAGEQLTTLFNNRKALEEQKAELDKALAQSDQMKKNAARIKELETREKEIAQSIADIEQQLDEIGQYKAAESKAVEESVNSKFKYVKFKLFNIILNGSVEDTCESMLNGVTYSDLSTGQKILVGVDIISVLSKHYGLSIPLFCDNLESMTLPLDFDGQLIKLVAMKSQEKLSVNYGK